VEKQECQTRLGYSSNKIRFTEVKSTVGLCLHKVLNVYINLINYVFHKLYSETLGYTSFQHLVLFVLTWNISKTI